MDEIKKRITEVLQNGYLLSLASVDDHGPWVSDVIYISDEKFNIYFISRPEFRHSKAYLQNARAAGAITAREKPEGQSTGVQMEGAVTLAQSIPDETFAFYSKKRGANAWRLEAGDAWYKFTPTKIDLIYEPIYGYTKKTLTLP